MAKTGERVTKSEKKERGAAKRILKILLAAAAVFVVFSLVSTALYPLVIFGRSDGATRFSLSYADIDAEAYPREPFEFRSGGNTLRGYLYAPDDPKGLVVIVNGIKNGADCHLPHITAFYDDGWAIATYDATGVGQSDGWGTVGLPQVKVDLFAFLEYLSGSGLFSDLPTVLFSHSAGGYAASRAVAEDPRIDAAVIIAPYDRASEVMIYQSRRYVGPLADAEYPFLKLSLLTACGADADDPAHESLARASVPVMIVEGVSDDAAPPSTGLSRFKDELSANPNVTFYTVDDIERNEHSTLWLTHDAAEYVNTYDGDAPDKRAANELDPGFLAVVLDFMNAAIGR